jgi:phage N-6-adenine-methyltransferase
VFKSGGAGTAVTDTVSGPLLLNADTEAAAIGAMYADAKDSMVESVRLLLECGERLRRKKESLGHGNWLPWLTENERILGFGERTAQLLMLGAVNTKPASDLSERDAVQVSRQIWGHTHNHRAIGTGEDERYTPQKYIELARRVLGDIDLDPASSETAQRVVNAAQYFTAADNGLRKEWHGRVWLNPPYSQPLIHEFVSKLIEERSAERVSCAIMLTNNYTDTSWFHAALEIAEAVCFTRGRISFNDADGNELGSPPQGSAFFYFGDDASEFAKVFIEAGSVVEL